MDKLFSVFLALFLSSTAFAATVKLGETAFELKRPNAINAVISASTDISGFLRNFKPQGAQISRLQVSGDNLEFVVTKKILMISKSARVNADVDVARNNPNCPALAATSFQVSLDFDKSDDLVADNIDTVRMDFCVFEPVPDQIRVTAKGFLTQGPRYDSIIGGVMVSEISNQIPALVQAFKLHVVNQR